MGTSAHPHAEAVGHQRTATAEGACCARAEALRGEAGLPSPLLNQIKRLAAFQNPEFYKKQSMRLSTATTPRVIACAEDLPKYVALPRGCRDELEALLRDYGVSLEVDDQRVGGQLVKFQFQGTLTSVQQAAADA